MGCSGLVLPDVSPGGPDHPRRSSRKFKDFFCIHCFTQKSGSEAERNSRSLQPLQLQPCGHPLWATRTVPNSSSGGLFLYKRLRLVGRGGHVVLGWVRPCLLACCLACLSRSSSLATSAGSRGLHLCSSCPQGAFPDLKRFSVRCAMSLRRVEKRIPQIGHWPD